ncbi:MAG: hypothetical protein OXU45_06525 [Candidatus Melainabacteria bacterium]|nr:hypothetical protein [Candidatus Melainabacteria bacterium]
MEANFINTIRETYDLFCHKPSIFWKITWYWFVGVVLGIFFANLMMYLASIIFIALQVLPAGVTIPATMFGPELALTKSGLQLMNQIILILLALQPILLAVMSFHSSVYQEFVHGIEVKTKFKTFFRIFFKAYWVIVKTWSIPLLVLAFLAKYSSVAIFTVSSLVIFPLVIFMIVKDMLNVSVMPFLICQSDITEKNLLMQHAKSIPLRIKLNLYLFPVALGALFYVLLWAPSLFNLNFFDRLVDLDASGPGLVQNFIAIIVDPRTLI